MPLDKLATNPILGKDVAALVSFMGFQFKILESNIELQLHFMEVLCIRIKDILNNFSTFQYLKSPILPVSFIEDIPFW